jgi:hypothetical protein
VGLSQVGDPRGQVHPERQPPAACDPLPHTHLQDLWSVTYGAAIAVAVGVTVLRFVRWADEVRANIIIIIL